MLRIHVVITAATLSLGQASAQEGTRLPRGSVREQMTVGYLHNRQVYALGAVRVPTQRGTDLADAGVVLEACSLGREGNALLAVKYRDLDGISQGLPYRWRIANGCFWGTGAAADNFMGLKLRRIPLTELPLYDEKNKKREQEFKRLYPKALSENMQEVHEWALDPVAEEARTY